jgi:hypothetical protein
LSRVQYFSKLVKCGRLGVISEMPLLPLRG